MASLDDQRLDQDRDQETGKKNTPVLLGSLSKRSEKLR
jgi:hypothetical protein